MSESVACSLSRFLVVESRTVILVRDNTMMAVRGCLPVLLIPNSRVYVLFREKGLYLLFLEGDTF